MSGGDGTSGKPEADPTALVIFRKMTLSDVDEVARLESLIFSDAWSAAAFRREIEGGDHCWPVVAEAEGRLIGYMIAWTVADEVHLGNIAVSPENRRHGLGQRLVDHLVERATTRNARLITLEVRRSNEPAQALYSKNGFYPVMVRRGYYSDNREDALVMVRPLNEAGRIPPFDPGT